MNFVSEDQRKAVMAKLRGGGSGGRHGGGGYNKPYAGGGGGNSNGYTTVTWTFGTPATAQNKGHQQPTSAGIDRRGGNFQGVQVTIPTGSNWAQFDKAHGIASPSDWANTSMSDIFNFNKGTAVTGAQWASGIKMLFEPRGQTSEEYYEAVAKRAGVNPPPYDGFARDAYYAFGGSANQGQGATETGNAKPKKKPLQNIFPWISND